MASLSHILEQTVPAGKSNQNPAYARASVLTEAAAVCLQIEATPLLKVCLAKVGSPPVYCHMKLCHRTLPHLMSPTPPGLYTFSLRLPLVCAAGCTRWAQQE